MIPFIYHVKQRNKVFGKVARIFGIEIHILYLQKFKLQNVRKKFQENEGNAYLIVKNARAKPVIVAEWIACLLAVWGVSQSSPGILPLLHACRECDLLPCWLSRGQQVSHQRWIWARDPGFILALKPRADVTRSPKQGYQWPQKKDVCPPKILRNMQELQGP